MVGGLGQLGHERIGPGMVGGLGQLGHERWDSRDKMRVTYLKGHCMSSVQLGFHGGHRDSSTEGGEGGGVSVEPF